MTIAARARDLIARSKHNASQATVERRIRNGWSDEKIIATKPQRKPPSDHPLKTPCWTVVAKRKGWKIDAKS